MYYFLNQDNNNNNVLLSFEYRCLSNISAFRLGAILMIELMMVCFSFCVCVNCFQIEFEI